MTILKVIAIVPCTMTNATHLPDVMPEIEKQTLFVVCDTHKCIFMEAHGRTIATTGGVESKAEEFTDSKEGRTQSPAAFGKGGMISGNDDMNQIEKNRLREFANNVWHQVEGKVMTDDIEEVYISAPNKFLASLKEHEPKAISKKVIEMFEGNFIKEPALDLVARFRPDMNDAAADLRGQENFSAKNRP